MFHYNGVDALQFMHRVSVVLGLGGMQFMFAQLQAMFTFLFCNGLEMVSVSVLRRVEGTGTIMKGGIEHFYIQPVFRMSFFSYILTVFLAGTPPPPP